MIDFTATTTRKDMNMMKTREVVVLAAISWRFEEVDGWSCMVISCHLLETIFPDSSLEPLASGKFLLLILCFSQLLPFYSVHTLYLSVIALKAPPLLLPTLLTWMTVFSCIATPRNHRLPIVAPLTIMVYFIATTPVRSPAWS